MKLVKLIAIAAVAALAIGNFRVGEIAAGIAYLIALLMTFSAAVLEEQVAKELENVETLLRVANDLERQIRLQKLHIAVLLDLLPKDNKTEPEEK